MINIMQCACSFCSSNVPIYWIWFKLSPFGVLNSRNVEEILVLVFVLVVTSLIGKRSSVNVSLPLLML